LFEISEVCEPSLDTPPEMAEVPVAPSFEPADICLNIDSLQVVKYKFIQVNYKVVLTILVHDLFHDLVQTR